jgi:hypothetical protein
MGGSDRMPQAIKAWPVSNPVTSLRSATATRLQRGPCLLSGLPRSERLLELRPGELRNKESS